MRRLALAFVTVALGQPLGTYSGVWTADLNGTTYLRLTLNDKAGTPQGSMSIGKSIQVDGQEVSKFELRLVDPNTADLTMLLPEEERQELAAEGIPIPKPFRLAKSR